LQDGQLYSDDSGLEVLFRPRFSNLIININSSADYIPAVTVTYLQDKESQFTILTDRTHGVSSNSPGELEIMLLRRTNNEGDQISGLILNDTSHVNESFYIMFDQPDTTQNLRHTLSYYLNYPLTLIYGSNNANLQQWTKSNYITSFSALSAPLPQNLHFLTLQALDSTPQSDVVFRVNHIYEVNDSTTWSMPATIDLSTLFSSFTFSNITEKTLTLNYDAANCQRLSWNSQSNSDQKMLHYNIEGRKHKQQPTTQAYPVTLTPIQIKTFASPYLLQQQINRK